MPTRTAAFFDVDDTLITVTSMFRFLAFDLGRQGKPPGTFDAAMNELARLKALGHKRSQTNRAFYRHFTGRDAHDIAASGREWFNAESAIDGFFNRKTLAAFNAHLHRRHLTVLVSGSFPPCLDPVAEHIGANVVLCTRPEIRNGIYTGEVATPMVDAEKAVAVLATATELNINLADSYAYGDHLSDLPLLELVGHPVVVGDNLDLAHIANHRGWTRLVIA